MRVIDGERTGVMNTSTVPLGRLPPWGWTLTKFHLQLLPSTSICLSLWVDKYHVHSLYQLLIEQACFEYCDVLL